jgi:hypothetical protein
VRTDTFRASGAGGQHINKTDSAVRLTHIPTGIVVQCQDGRSQHSNRDVAWKRLRSRLYDHEMRKRQEEQQKLEDTKTDVGWGHQIRSYVLDNSRIKDLRTNVEISQHAEGARRRPRRLHRSQPEAGPLTPGRCRAPCALGRHGPQDWNLPMETMREGTATVIRREDYAAPAFWIRSVDLTFDLDPAKTIVISKLRSSATPRQSRRSRCACTART